MFYHGDPLSAGESNEIGLGIATSIDGIEWTRADEPFFGFTGGRALPAYTSGHRSGRLHICPLRFGLNEW